MLAAFSTVKADEERGALAVRAEATPTSTPTPLPAATIDRPDRGDSLPDLTWATDSLPAPALPASGFLSPTQAPAEPLPLPPAVLEPLAPAALSPANPSISHSLLTSPPDETAMASVRLGTPVARQAIADHWNPIAGVASLLHPPVPNRLRKWTATFWKDHGRSQPATRDLGIGHERVMFAPSIVDTAIGSAHIGFRFQADSGLSTPDRAGYYWGPPPLGPPAEANVDTLDTLFRMELGNERAMALTQFTMRSLDPTRAENTTGFGDMVVGGKVLMVDGKRLKLSSIFRTYLPTGPEQHGLGTGHTSLEPGLLARYCVSPKTFWFGELKYWLPIGGDPMYSGDVLTTGLAVSTIFHESDVYAMLPTLEVRTLSFLFGAETQPDGTVRHIDGKTAVEIYPGVRFVLGPQGDLGLWELGISTGVTAADNDWFDTRMLIDLRWNY